MSDITFNEFLTRLCRWTLILEFKKEFELILNNLILIPFKYLYVSGYFIADFIVMRLLNSMLNTFW